MKIVSTEKTIEDITHWTAEQKATVRFARLENTDGVEKMFAVYPKGTEVFGAQAEQLLRLGKARVIEVIE